MRWTHRGDANLFARERDWLEETLAGGKARLERRDGPGGACFAKASPLRGKAAVRHAARRAVGLPLPRLAEFRNLGWLREHGFQAPEPLLAGAAWSGGLPRLQFLFTRAVEDAPALERLLTEEDPRGAEAALELARVAARLHIEGFVHRDLFARNALVQGDAVWLLDAWRGGPGPGLRGWRYDVGCLAHDLGRLGDGALASQALGAYAEERERCARPVDRDDLDRAVRRVGRGLSAREERRLRRRGSI